MDRSGGVHNGFVVGAYAASPAHAVWQPDLEAAYYDALAQDPRIAALELPWMGGLHPHDDAWFLAHFPARFRAVYTDIPHVMTTLASDASFGLASTDSDGRARALLQAAAVRNDVRRLNDATGRAIVVAIELHSAPRGGGSIDALSRSLASLQSWDWDGASVVLEHCDAWREGQRAEKGFLALDDEILAIERAGADVGISLNWGRSAIEFRDADRVVEHITAARASGHLQGFIASGAADHSGPFGDAWVDAHLPFQRNAAHPLGDDASLLTEERLVAALSAAGPLAWIGVKMGWPPGVEGSVAQRMDMIRAALDACERARANVREAVASAAGAAR